MHEAELALVRDQVRLNRECTVRVGGFCMAPAILSGARVTVQAAHPDELLTGDVVAYALGTNLLVHRLVDRVGDRLVMRADSGRPGRHEIEGGLVVGKVCGVDNPTVLARTVRRLAAVWERLK